MLRWNQRLNDVRGTPNAFAKRLAPPGTDAMEPTATDGTGDLLI